MGTHHQLQSDPRAPSLTNIRWRRVKGGMQPYLIHVACPKCGGPHVEIAHKPAQLATPDTRGQVPDDSPLWKGEQWRKARARQARARGDTSITFRGKLWPVATFDLPVRKAKGLLKPLPPQTPTPPYKHVGD